MRAKFSNANEFESALRDAKLSMYSYYSKYISTDSVGKHIGATWVRYKTGDPSEEFPGDVSVVLRRNKAVDGIKTTIDRFNHSTNLYKRISAIADFRVVRQAKRNFITEGPYIEMFEMEVEWNYGIGTDPYETQ